MSVETILIKVQELPLWNHQVDAISSILRYFTKARAEGFLVKMPTGTGKTGVFSALSRVALPNKNFLIIVPSTTLKFQVIEELSLKFWTKIGHDTTKLTKKEILGTLPSTIENDLKATTSKSFILVSTIQGLQQIKTSKPAEFEKLKPRIDYVIFDEGHKEPAYTWSTIVREINKPTILFSATPYRNDLKVLNIAKDDFFSFSHEDGVENKILREIDFKKINLKVDTPTAFVNELLSLINKNSTIVASQGIKNPKVIIRCKTKEHIEAIVKILKKLKKRAVGIHERFINKNDLLDCVPDSTNQEDYDFFVHQNKLIEGVDNPSFCHLAFYGNFTNGRELIQQIGRIIRNTDKTKNQTGYVYSVFAKQHKGQWEDYLSYDKDLASTNKLFDIKDVLAVNKEVKTLYFEGCFRELVNVDGLDLFDKVLLQTKANIYLNKDNYSLSEIAEIVIKEWETRDYQILKTQEADNKSSFMILYIVYSNSPLVKSGLFIEQKLAVTYFTLDDKYITFYDSEFNNPFYYHSSISNLNSQRLMRVLNEKVKLTAINLMNSDIGSNSVRTRAITSPKIEDIAPYLADHMFVPTRVEGYVKNAEGGAKRRYVGVQNSRVSDHSSVRIDSANYLQWLNDTMKPIKSTKFILEDSLQSFLGRHAERVEAPTVAVPVSILLDCSTDYLDDYLFDGSETIEIADLCSEVDGNTFWVSINQEAFQFQISYDYKFEKFYLECSEADERIELKDEKDGPSFTGYLNATQCFRIITKGNALIYAYKNFYKPSLTVAGKDKTLDLFKILVPTKTVRGIEREKGDDVRKVSGLLWHKDTLFGLVARMGDTYPEKLLKDVFDFDYLVCDDLETEIADFIGLSEKDDRVVFIHAKHGNASLSASAFHDVCSQATKNLDYLTPFHAKKPQRNLDKWGKVWDTGKGIGTVKNRMIKGGLKPAAFWAKYKKLMENPKVNREVIILMGNGFDCEKFKKELKKKDIAQMKPEVIQLIYILTSTWAHVSSVGATLKILC